MSIFDIFNTKKEDKYKGYTLSSQVDDTLEKQLIDRGRGSEINSLSPSDVKNLNTSMDVTANSTPAIISTGKNSLAPEPVTVKSVASDITNKSVDYLSAVEKTSKGEIKRDDGSVVMTQDLPGIQQAAGAVFSVGKDIAKKSAPLVSAAKSNIETRDKFYKLLSQGDMKGAQDLYKDKEDPLQVAFNDAVFNNPTGRKILKFTSDKTRVTSYIPGAKEAMDNNKILSFVGGTADAIVQNLVGVGLAFVPYAGKVLSPAYYSAISAQDQIETKGKVTSIGNIVIDTAGDRILGNTIEQFLKQGKVGAKSVWKEFNRVGLVEGGTEVLQTLTKNLNDYQNANNDDERKGVVQSLKNYFTSGDVLTEFGIGYISGGTVSGIINSVAGSHRSGTDNIITIPESSYSLKSGSEEKYFQTEEAAKKYISDNGIKDDYTLEKMTDEQIKKVANTTTESSFPFVEGKTTQQTFIDDTIDDIVAKGLTKSQAVDYVYSFIPAGETTPEIYSQAVSEAKASLETGEPAIIQQAIDIAKANNDFVSEKQEAILPENVYHQTSSDIEAIKDTGFKMGKNSVFGEAAFFGEKANELYGENQIVVKPSQFNLKTFKTVKEQQDYISKFNAKNLSEAINTEGKYDGFIIPNPEGNIVGITNKEKLNTKLKQQQFISTEEAKKVSSNFKFIEDLKLPVNVVDKILTPAGKEAFGSYYNGVISFIENPHKTTIPHEATHAFLDLMLTAKQKKIVLDEVKRRYAGKKFNDQQAEEQLAEDFAKYYTQKFDNPETAKAPSNKIKQFFDWFIDQLKRLVGKGDIIQNLYKDIEKSRPGIIKKEAIRRKIQRGNYSIEELQKEYFQNPDALTAKFLENVDVKNREVAGYQFLKDLLKSKSLPLKETERNLIDDILETQFKDEKKINMDDFRAAVRTELMPLQVIESETYSDYGQDQVDMSDFDATTHIYNSPFNHGYSGHFSGDFSNEIRKTDLEVKQIPGKEKFAVIRTGVTLTEANIAENVLHVANSEAEANTWINNRVKDTRVSSAEDGLVDVGVRGLFGHTRIWDEVDNYASADSVGGIRYVAEVQSDAFQNLERITDRSEKYFEMFNSVAEAEKVFDENKKEVFIINDGDEYAVEEKSEIASAFKSGQKVGYEMTKPATKDEANFLQFKNNWHERLIREEIRRAAMDNKTKLRFPTPYTISKIEGYLSEGGQIPTGTEVGGTFEYAGDEYILLKDEFGETGVAAPYGDVRGTWDFDTVRDEDVNRKIDDLFYQVKEAKDIAEIKSITDDYFSDEQLKELKKYIKEGEDAEISAMVEPLANQRVDERYTDAQSYADYYEENIEEGFTYATEDNQVIILNDNTHLETLGIGSTEAQKENFNYEEDLDGKEQKTVARFYDKQVGRYLAKLRKQNFRTVTDDNGYDWLETDILPEDKAAVEAFQTKPAEEPIKRSGEEVANYVEEIQTDNDEEIDENLSDIIKTQDFKLTSVKITDLLNSDPDLKSYVDANENRYDEDHEGDYSLPIVVGFWDPITNIDYGVLDGYNRVLTNVQNGNEYIEAWVADQTKYQEMTDDQKELVDKARAEKIVRDETIKKGRTVKNAINVSQGRIAPTKVTMKETTLLKKKLRDMARGVKIGRSDMRATLIDTFRTKQENIAEIKKAIVNYASELPANEKAKLLPLVVNSKTQLDLTKAMMRVDAAMEMVDKKEQLQEVKKAASIVKKAVKTGRGIAVDYQKRLIDILDNYDLQKPTARTIAKLTSLKEYVESNPGFVPDYVVEKLDRLSKKNPGQMTIGEIKDLNDTLNQLIALGHLKLQLKNNYDDRVKEANLTKLLVNTRSLDPKGNPTDPGYNQKEAKKNMYLHSIHSFRVTDMIDNYLDYHGQNTHLQRLISQKVNNSELTADATLSSVFDEIKTFKKTWTDEEQAIMEFHLLIQQGANTQANELASSKGWTEAPQLTPEMEAAMDLMRGTFKKTEDYLAAVYEEINNKPFEKVDNYFPLKYEQKKGEIPEPTIGQKIMRSSKTEQGFTIKRMENVKRVPRSDVFAQFEEAIREQQYFMQVQPALLEVRSLVNDEAYKEKAGRVVTGWWRDYIDAMSNRGQLSGVRSNAWLRQKRINLSKAILGFKASSILMQPMAIFDAYSYVQLRFGQIAAARMMFNFANSWINPAYARKVMKLSPSIQLRKGTSGELALEEIAGASKKKKIIGKIERASMAPLQYFDIKTAASVDQGIYKILKRKGLSDSEARAEADLIMNIVSGSSEIADRPMVLMKDEIYRTIFTFQTFMLNRWGLIAHDIINSGLIHGNFSRKLKSLYALFILGIAGGIENELRAKIYETIKGKPLDNPTPFWTAAITSIPEAIPIIGQIVQGLTQYGTGSGVPLIRIMENFRTGLQQINSDDPAKKKKGAIRIGEALGTWYGVPGSAQFADLLEREPTEIVDKSTNLNIELPALPELDLPELPELPVLPAL